jgi:uncharacterized membrane protein
MPTPAHRPLHHRLLPSPLRARPRLVLAALLGAVAATQFPAAWGLVARGLMGWNTAVWAYLLMAAAMMWRADHHHVRRLAQAQAEGAHTVLALVTMATAVSLIGVVVELSAAKVPGTGQAWPHVALALLTVTGAWLLVHTLFALTYASVYHRHDVAAGLAFPRADGPSDATAFQPDYADFLYFAFTIAVASQTADVSINTQPMRRLVLMHSLLAFAFNTAILAFTINLAASLF